MFCKVQEFGVQIPGKNCIPATSLAIVFIICICTTDTSASPKRSKLYRDISAIGHRNIGGDKGLGNFYSFNKEQELGTELSFDFEKENLLLSDSATTDYIQRIAQNIAQNSDAQMPVTVRRKRRKILRSCFAGRVSVHQPWSSTSITK
jgi:hypothetical protein